MIVLIWLVLLTVVAICALGSVVFFFSVLLSVFRSKHEGYPYRYRHCFLKIILWSWLVTCVAQQFQVFATTLEGFCATSGHLFVFRKSCVVKFRNSYKLQLWAIFFLKDWIISSAWSSTVTMMVLLLQFPAEVASCVNISLRRMFFL